MVVWLKGRELPDPEREANEDGLVALGGSFDPELLIAAYRAGIFPWSCEPVLNWWSPDPRSVFDLDRYTPSHSLRKSMRRAGWRFSVDEDFRGVMLACAAATPNRPATWIAPPTVTAYCELHRRGQAHSVEVWEGAEMVGGLYGVTLGGFFGGESMFSRRTDASKAAVFYLVQRLRERGFVLLDAQVPHPHLRSLGAVEIPRPVYLQRLRTALLVNASFV
jgi:leucyl/phenylalanyl-tRNA--protein transferase